jgi:uncharacterized protein (DUF1330 family)
MLIGGGVVGSALALGATGPLIAVEEEGGQPGDQVGEAARRERILRLVEQFGDQPVDMLNLLKFKPGGQASYMRYGAEFGKLVAKFAPETEVVYQGQCKGLLIGAEEWDLVIIVRYPSMTAFLALTSSADYDEIAHLRLDALERAVLYAMAPAAGGN